jgi:hypothetical protein
MVFAKKFLMTWAVAFLAFGAFMVTSLCWGGAALNGKIETGRFYLGLNGHFQEVGRGQYAVNAALNVIWPLALLSGLPGLVRLFPSTSDSRKLNKFLIFFFCLGFGGISIASLVCLLRAIT